MENSETFLRHVIGRKEKIDGKKIAENPRWSSETTRGTIKRTFPRYNGSPLLTIEYMEVITPAYDVEDDLDEYSSNSREDEGVPPVVITRIKENVYPEFPNSFGDLEDSDDDRKMQSFSESEVWKKCILNKRNGVGRTGKEKETDPRKNDKRKSEIEKKLRNIGGIGRHNLMDPDYVFGLFRDTKEMLGNHLKSSGFSRRTGDDTVTVEEDSVFLQFPLTLEAKSVTEFSYKYCGNFDQLTCAVAFYLLVRGDCEKFPDSDVWIDSFFKEGNSKIKIFPIGDKITDVSYSRPKNNGKKDDERADTTLSDEDEPLLRMGKCWVYCNSDLIVEDDAEDPDLQLNLMLEHRFASDTKYQLFRVVVRCSPDTNKPLHYNKKPLPENISAIETVNMDGISDRQGLESYLGYDLKSNQTVIEFQNGLLTCSGRPPSRITIHRTKASDETVSTNEVVRNEKDQNPNGKTENNKRKISSIITEEEERKSIPRDGGSENNKKRKETVIFASDPHYDSCISECVKRFTENGEKYYHPCYALKTKEGLYFTSEALKVFYLSLFDKMEDKCDVKDTEHRRLLNFAKIFLLSDGKCKVKMSKIRKIPPTVLYAKDLETGDPYVKLQLIRNEDAAEERGENAKKEGVTEDSFTCFLCDSPLRSNEEARANSIPVDSLIPCPSCERNAIGELFSNKLMLYNSGSSLDVLMGLCIGLNNLSNLLILRKRNNERKRTAISKDKFENHYVQSVKSLLKLYVSKIK